LCFAIIHYVRSYGASALLLTILSLITVFRREMSSNRVYLTEEEREREVRRRRRRRRTRRESEGSRDTSSSSELKLATTTSSLPNDNATNQSNIDTYKKDCHSYEEEEEEEYCDETDDLLDRAGLYCSGFGEIIKIILSVWAHMLLSQIHEGESEKKKINEDGSIPNKATKENTLFVGGAKEEETTLSSPKPSSSLSLGKKTKTINHPRSKANIAPSAATINTTGSLKNQSELYLITIIPPDAQVHLFTYLHPRDILDFACVSKSCYSLIDSEQQQQEQQYGISALLWKTLWRRDYAWVVLEWNVGRKALQRSLSLLSSSCAEQTKHQGSGKTFTSSFMSYAPSLLGGGKSNIGIKADFHRDDITTRSVLRRLSSAFHEQNVLTSSPSSSSEYKHENSTHDSLKNSDAGDNDGVTDITLPSLPSFIFSSTTNTGSDDNAPIDGKATAKHESIQQRQEPQQVMTMKEFYFTFSQCWINYTLAGQSTYDNCLVGLHGHVFDITDFLEEHPGSPETLLVNGGGRDATKYFEDLGHSVSARKMAGRSLCVVLDSACLRKNRDDYDDDDLMVDDSYHSIHSYNDDGMRGGNGSLTCPTTFCPWGLKHPKKSSLSTYQLQNHLLPLKRSKPTRPGTIYSIRKRLEEEQTNELKRAKDCFSSNGNASSSFGDVHIYYDPFLGKWRSWYLNGDFEAVFI